MLEPRRGFFPDPHGERYPFENLAEVLQAAFTEMDREQSEQGNTKHLTELGVAWGRKIMLSLRDAAERYRTAGGQYDRPIRIGEWEVRSSVTEVDETDDPHLSVEIYRRGGEEDGRQEFKLAVSTFDGLRDEGMFPPKLEGTIKVSEILELRFRVFLPWNWIAEIERTEVKDSPDFNRGSLYVVKVIKTSVIGRPQI